MKTRALLWISLLLLALAGCGNLAVGIEKTPPPDLAATATITSLAAQNAGLQATVTALQPTAITTATLGLVYERDGKIYRGDFAGNAAEPLATLPSAVQDILYQADYFAARSSLKLNGNRLAYGAKGTIGVIDLDTGVDTPLYKLPATAYLGNGGHDLMWSSDGKSLVYSIAYNNNPEAVTPNNTSTEVGVIDIESRTHRIVTVGQSVGSGFSLISYDVAADLLWLVPHGGDPAVNTIWAYHVADPSIAPVSSPIAGDGIPAGSTRFMAVSSPHDFENRIARTLIYDLSSAAVGEPWIIQHPAATYGTHYLWHGDRLAFLLGQGVSWQATTGIAEAMFGWTPADEQPIKLAPASLPNDMPLAWSPDGAWLASVQGEAGVARYHWAASATGGEPVRLQVAENAHVLGWSE
jgi:hypothetical protein